MEEFKGTPGPWHVSNEGHLVIRDNAESSIVAKYVGYCNDDEEFSNARLIASAPELLNALQLALKAMREGRNVTHPEWYRAVNQAQQAINKALGK